MTLGSWRGELLLLVVLAPHRMPSATVLQLAVYTLIPVLPVALATMPLAELVRAPAQACVLKLATERVRHGCVSSRLIVGRGIDWAGRRRGRRHRHRLERSHLGHVFF